MTTPIDVQKAREIVESKRLKCGFKDKFESRSMSITYKQLLIIEVALDALVSENAALDFWKDIVVEGNGELDIEQVKKELHDYHVIFENVSKVYDHVTGGRVSKSNTLAGVVIELADEHYDELYSDEEPTK